MGFAWSALFLLSVFLLPGIIAVFAYFQRREVKTPDLGLTSNLAFAVAFALVIHGSLLVLVHLLKQPPPDIASLLALAAGSFRGTEDFVDIAEIVRLSWLRFLLYSIAGWVFGYILGRLSAKVVGRLIPPTESERFLLSEEGVYTFVDVLVEGNVLYRGIHHSHAMPIREAGGYLNLFLASRWVGPRTTHDDGNFKPIKGSVTMTELLEMIAAYLSACIGDDAQAIKKFDEMLAADRGVEKYLQERNSEHPQLCIPWGRILNINTRQFFIGSI